MMTRCEHCDRDRLKRLLDESLPETVESEVSEHVAACPTCQAELEAIAAERSWWAEAEQRLRSSGEIAVNGRVGPAALRRAGPPDSVSNPDGGPALEASLSHPTSDDADVADFAVDCLEPSDDPAMLGRLGEYEIVEVIGRGGMGIVLKGFQKELQRYVAVKVLAPHLATSGAARRRFAREAQATAAIVHPHVMAIHSVHANSKLPYLVMPFVPCESLQQRLDRQGPLDVKEVLRIGMQAALGLAAAHAQGLVHRDVKPANILLETNVERVMLTDFGLARAVDDATLTRTGIIAGTPQYMSPEQANGDAVDHRSDLFSLGSVLYAMCTGRPPFRAETTFGVLRRIRETPPRPIREINADIPEWLERIVMKLLAKSPAERFATATEVAALLEQCLAHVQQPTTVALPDVLWASKREVDWTRVATRLCGVSAGLLTVLTAGMCCASVLRSASGSVNVSVVTTVAVLIGVLAWRLRRARIRQAALFAFGVLATVIVLQWLTLPWPNAEQSERHTVEPTLSAEWLEWDSTQQSLDSTARMLDAVESIQRKDVTEMK